MRQNVIMRHLHTAEQVCEVYISKTLEQAPAAKKHRYLFDQNESLADLALLPFYSDQFARIETPVVICSHLYPRGQAWLNPILTKAQCLPESWQNTLLWSPRTRAVIEVWYI